MEAPARVLDVYRQQQSSGAAADLEGALAMLASARYGRLGPALRIYRPQPTVAFGQRDARLPGFAAAAAACREQGFEPLVRKAGGRAAAYHGGCLILDHIEPEPNAVARSLARFAGFAELLAAALQDAGVPAAVGEIPGEYCPGEYTVHGGTGDARIKLVGTAQRVVSGAWLFSSVVVVRNADPLRRVLTSVYAALGLDWDPETAGAAEDLVPGLTMDDAETALLGGYRRYAGLRQGDVSLLEEITGGPVPVLPTTARCP
ncbi:lipoate--protein ligase family protein [Arthrobacter sp. Helios]|uniref:lipoate--protein ligase family protein n=1 Tax=Arthrobacter sp. Helios TaxID=2828862 RepID=UPI00204A9412|nr:lipoate--protein ligase family protein [Arthrobacter sp. Helios]UPO78479.1 lipoate--protein ligase family protein [Arthrobacter sp. Helios]